MPDYEVPVILSAELKQRSSFGKDGAKNFPGILTGHQMQLYLVIGGFRRRRHKRSAEYGMPVSVIMTPESVWEYRHLSSVYGEEPGESWQRILDYTMEMYPDVDEHAIIKLIGRKSQ